MIEEDELTAYFWESANQVISIEDVEIDFHNSLIEVSVLLKNEIENKVRLQLVATFAEPEDFIEAFGLEMVEEIGDITIQDVFVLYQKGGAELIVTD
jgi:hypothetical protein